MKFLKKLVSFHSRISANNAVFLKNSEFSSKSSVFTLRSMPSKKYSVFSAYKKVQTEKFFHQTKISCSDILVLLAGKIFFAIFNVNNLKKTCCYLKKTRKFCQNTKTFFGFFDVRIQPTGDNVPIQNTFTAGAMKNLLMPTVG